MMRLKKTISLLFLLMTVLLLFVGCSNSESSSDGNNGEGAESDNEGAFEVTYATTSCLLYTSPSPRDS